VGPFFFFFFFFFFLNFWEGVFFFFFFFFSFFFHFHFNLCSKLTRCPHRPRSSRAGSDFFEDPTSDPALRATLDDYRGSGLDRGHMAPAADASRLSQAAMDETFSLSQIVPQHPELNRKYWARMEAMVRKLGREHDDVFVISGPLFLPHRDER
jgi:DNA/RNA endonuclease G (NUC1)